jgi:hypothetical protein
MLRILKGSLEVMLLMRLLTAFSPEAPVLAYVMLVLYAAASHPQRKTDCPCDEAE